MDLLPFLLLLFVWCQSKTLAITINSTENGHQLEDFKINYLTQMEYKITNILTTVNVLDQNLKFLQEKAQALDIFQYHISRWSDQMQSIDDKLNHLLTNNALIIPIESKITSIEYVINHIFSKVDLINEKLNGEQQQKQKVKSSNVINDDCVDNEKINKILKYIEMQEQREKSDRKELINRMNAIQRQLSYVERTVYQHNGNESGGLNRLELSESIKTITKINKDNQNTLKNIETSMQEMENELKVQNENGQYIKEYLEGENIVKSVKDQLISLSNHSVGMQKITENTLQDIKDNIYEVKFRIINCTDRSNGINNNETITDHIEKKINQMSETGCHQLKDRISGIYTFGDDDSDLNQANRNYNKRYCDFTQSGVAWTIIQRRNQYEQQENFNRTWNEYKYGFGELSKEFWFGLEFIHRLSHEDNLELRIELEDWTDAVRWAEYSFFKIDSEQFNYNLQIDGYSGTVEDSLIYHNDQDFSTFDKQNDTNNSTCCPCAESYGSGWWFNNCIDSNLNGIYHKTPLDHNYVGIIWEKWLHDYSLKGTKMMVRPKDILFENENL